MKNGPYTLVVASDDYPGKKYRDRYIYEHHLVWWQNTGEIVPEGFTIHHKDENKRNNIFSNFELLTNTDHSKHHAKYAPKKELVCTFCRVKFFRAERYIKAKLKIGQTDFYCSLSCCAKHFGRGRSKV